MSRSTALAKTLAAADAVQRGVRGIPDTSMIVAGDTISGWRHGTIKRQRFEAAASGTGEFRRYPHHQREGLGEGQRSQPGPSGIGPFTSVSKSSLPSARRRNLTDAGVLPWSPPSVPRPIHMSPRRDQRLMVQPLSYWTMVRPSIRVGLISPVCEHSERSDAHVPWKARGNLSAAATAPAPAMATQKAKAATGLLVLNLMAHLWNQLSRSRCIQPTRPVCGAGSG